MNEYINITADLNYSNNSYSSFYHVLDQPLRINGAHEVGITDLSLSNEYKVLIGTLKIYVPDYIQHNMKYDESNSILNEERIIINNVGEMTKSRSTLLKELTDKMIEYKKLSEDSFNLEYMGSNDISLNKETKYESIIEEIHNIQNNLIKLFEKINIYIQTYSVFYPNIVLLINDLIYKNLLDQYSLSFKYLYKITDNMNLFMSEIEKSLKLFQNVYDYKLKEHSFDLYTTDHNKLDNIIKPLYKMIYKHAVLIDSGIRFKPYIKHIELDESLTKLFNLIKINLKLQIGDSSMNIELNQLMLKESELNQTKLFKIYNDIIEDTHLSGKKEKVLKIIKSENTSYGSIEKTYNNPQYITINKSCLDKIYIKIVDQNNNLVKFKSTPVLTLNIKKKRK